MIRLSGRIRKVIQNILANKMIRSRKESFQEAYRNNTTIKVFKSDHQGLSAMCKAILTSEFYSGDDEKQTRSQYMEKRRQAFSMCAWKPWWLAQGLPKQNKKRSDVSEPGSLIDYPGFTIIKQQVSLQEEDNDGTTVMLAIKRMRTHVNSDWCKTCQMEFFLLPRHSVLVKHTPGILPNQEGCIYY